MANLTEFEVPMGDEDEEDGGRSLVRSDKVPHTQVHMDHNPESGRDPRGTINIHYSADPPHSGYSVEMSTESTIFERVILSSDLKERKDVSESSLNNFVSNLDGMPSFEELKISGDEPLKLPKRMIFFTKSGAKLSTETEGTETELIKIFPGCVIYHCAVSQYMYCDEYYGVFQCYIEDHKKNVVFKISAVSEVEEYEELNELLSAVINGDKGVGSFRPPPKILGHFRRIVQEYKFQGIPAERQGGARNDIISMVKDACLLDDDFLCWHLENGCSGLPLIFDSIMKQKAPEQLNKIVDILLGRTDNHSFLFYLAREFPQKFAERIKKLPEKEKATIMVELFKNDDNIQSCLNFITEYFPEETTLMRTSFTNRQDDVMRDVSKSLVSKEPNGSTSLVSKQLNGSTLQKNSIYNHAPPHDQSNDPSVAVANLKQQQEDDSSRPPWWFACVPCGR